MEMWPTAIFWTRHQTLFIVMITESECLVYIPSEQFLVFKIEQSGLREKESLESISKVISIGKRMEKGLDAKLEKTELTIWKKNIFPHL